MELDGAKEVKGKGTYARYRALLRETPPRKCSGMASVLK